MAERIKGTVNNMERAVTEWIFELSQGKRTRFEGVYSNGTRLEKRVKFDAEITEKTAVAALSSPGGR